MAALLMSCLSSNVCTFRDLSSIGDQLEGGREGGREGRKGGREGRE